MIENEICIPYLLIDNIILTYLNNKEERLLSDELYSDVTMRGRGEGWVAVLHWCTPRHPAPFCCIDGGMQRRPRGAAGAPHSAAATTSSTRPSPTCWNIPHHQSTSPPQCTLYVRDPTWPDTRDITTRAVTTKHPTQKTLSNVQHLSLSRRSIDYVYSNRPNKIIIVN